MYDCTSKCIDSSRRIFYRVLVRQSSQTVTLSLKLSLLLLFSNKHLAEQAPCKIGSQTDNQLVTATAFRVSRELQQSTALRASSISQALGTSEGGGAWLGRQLPARRRVCGGSTQPAAACLGQVIEHPKLS